MREFKKQPPDWGAFEHSPLAVKFVHKKQKNIHECFARRSAAGVPAAWRHQEHQDLLWFFVNGRRPASAVVSFVDSK